MCRSRAGVPSIHHRANNILSAKRWLDEAVIGGCVNQGISQRGAKQARATARTGMSPSLRGWNCGVLRSILTKFPLTKGRLDDASRPLRQATPAEAGFVPSKISINLTPLPALHYRAAAAP
ncbi:hypothetical protein J6590_040176 [Homalodisca vitripennis]|nr:hypothetical protein J6590_040176 [Homalodisca vitripennis]